MPDQMPVHTEAWPDTSSFDAIVLAGGLARRLRGADKPAIRLGGRTLGAVAITAAAAAGAGAVIVVGPERHGLRSEVAASGQSVPLVFTSEDPPGSGPVPALAAGLELARSPWVLLLAADLPFLRPEHLRTLLAAAAVTGGALLTDDDGRPQWLASAWRGEMLRTALAGYRGESLRGVLEPLAPARVAGSAGPGQPPPWLDCDTPDDLRSAAAWLRRGGPVAQ